MLGVSRDAKLAKVTPQVDARRRVDASLVTPIERQRISILPETIDKWSFLSPSHHRLTGCEGCPLLHITLILRIFMTKRVFSFLCFLWFVDDW